MDVVVDCLLGSCSLAFSLRPVEFLDGVSAYILQTLLAKLRARASYSRVFEENKRPCSESDVVATSVIF